jgi:hypothetical protein
VKAWSRMINWCISCKHILSPFSIFTSIATSTKNCIRLERFINKTSLWLFSKSKLSMHCNNKKKQGKILKSFPSKNLWTINWIQKNSIMRNMLNQSYKVYLQFLWILHYRNCSRPQSMPSIAITKYQKLTKCSLIAT